MKRETEEVNIEIEFGGEIAVSTGDEVFDHLLTTLLFYMNKPGRVDASGDLPHHLWEDTGILLGETLRQEIQGGRIARYGSAVIPMDDALVLVAVDISRPYLSFDLDPEEAEEGFSTTLVKQFLSGLARSGEITLHMKQLNGENGHHVIEAGFKGLGAAFAKALQSSERVESTKGWLT